jgi:hypothetical protein
MDGSLVLFKKTAGAGFGKHRAGRNNHLNEGRLIL